MKLIKMFLVWCSLLLVVPVAASEKVVYSTEPLKATVKSESKGFYEDLKDNENVSKINLTDKLITVSNNLLNAEEIENINNELKSLIDQYETEKEALEQIEKIKEEESKKKEKVSTTVNLTSSVDTSDVWSIANSLAGTSGDCFYIVKLFYYYYKGGWNGLAYQTYSPEPGDVIFYEDGGLGTTHWAIYLGGDSALQGNFNGIAQIKTVYLNNASNPIFYKAN